MIAIGYLNMALNEKKKSLPIYLSAKLKVSKFKAKYIVKSTQDPFD